MSTLTVYPSSDGAAVMYPGTWAAVWGAAASAELNQLALGGYIYAQISGGQYYCARLFQNFDTSALPDDATISAVSSGLYGYDVSGTARTANVYGSTAQDSLTTADYDQGGTSAYCDTAIQASSWSTSAYNVFSWNATGIAAVSKTDKTKICYRDVTKDVANVAPEDADYIRNHQSAETGTSQDPYVTVTYTSTSLKTFDGLATASVKTVTGLAIASVKTYDGLA